LLRLAETVHFVNEEHGALALFPESLLRGGQRFPDIFHPGGGGRESDQKFGRRRGQQTSQRRLSCSGWTPQNGRAHPVRFGQSAQWGARTDEVPLPDHFVERAGAKPGRQGSLALQLTVGRVGEEAHAGIFASVTTEPASLDQIRSALATSADRLAAAVAPMGPDGVRAPSYCAEWTTADLLSHLGSGAEIFRQRFDKDGDVDMQAIWDTWNAKSPDDQAHDSLLADAALMARLAALDAAEEAAADRRFAMGPMNLDVVTFLSLRLSEHVVHTWDVEVMNDPTTTLPETAAALLVDSLGLMAGLVGKPTGTKKTITVHTSGPKRTLQFTVTGEGVTLTPAKDEAPVDLELPAEALIRLVYGRLDPDHTPPIGGTTGAATLDELRAVFPGF